VYSTRYFPGGHPLVGLLKWSLSAKRFATPPIVLTESVSNGLSSTFVLGGATAPTSSAISVPTNLLPRLGTLCVTHVA
jgi:hypothetical protein